MLTLTIKQEDLRVLTFYDTGNYHINNPNSVISKWILSIFGDNLKKIYTFDIMAYLKSRTVNGELLTLAPIELGFQDVFADGIYFYKNAINSVDYVESGFLVLSGVDSMLEEIATLTTKQQKIVERRLYTQYTDDVIRMLNDCYLIRSEMATLAAIEDYESIRSKLAILTNRLITILNLLKNGSCNY